MHLCLWQGKGLEEASEPGALVQLTWFEYCAHLGHILQNYNNMVKRNRFIDESVEGREAFEFASPVVVLEAVNL